MSTWLPIRSIIALSSAGYCLPERKTFLFIGEININTKLSELTSYFVFHLEFCFTLFLFQKPLTISSFYYSNEIFLYVPLKIFFCYQLHYVASNNYASSPCKLDKFPSLVFILMANICHIIWNLMQILLNGYCQQLPKNFLANCLNEYKNKIHKNLC